jgi:peroxiredoxin
MSEDRFKSILSAAVVLLFARGAAAQSLAGRWEATLTSNGVSIPFRMDFSGDGASVSGWFFNGDEHVVSSGGRFADGRLLLDFASYAAQLRATLTDGRLAGEYQTVRASYAFEARPLGAPPPSETAAPSIAGLWEIQVQSPKGESAWRLIVNQSGGEVSAAILRVDGDTGALTGRYRDGKFVLSHFSGARPALLVLTPSGDGSLAVALSGFKDKKEFVALRPEVARAKNLPPPTDPERHTTVKNAAEPFRFSFPDLNGRVVSNTDARFEGKVVLVNITGSWCPNCHDEAPFLAALYRQYRNQGVEIVALSFEEAAQLKNPERLRAFIREYGIEYPVLVAGEPDEVHDKLPQGVNLNCWPTTFILGRDGRVRAVHAGFPGHASGALRAEAEREFNASIDRLLAENHASE